MAAAWHLHLGLGIGEQSPKSARKLGLLALGCVGIVFCARNPCFPPRFGICETQVLGLVFLLETVTAHLILWLLLSPCEEPVFR